MAACDANDGVVGDGLIGDPRDCQFDPASIQCAGGQVRVVRTLYHGVFDKQGRHLDPQQLPRGSEMSWLRASGPADDGIDWVGSFLLHPKGHRH